MTTPTTTQPQPRQANGAAPKPTNAQWSDEQREAHRIAQETAGPTVPHTPPQTSLPPATADNGTFTRLAKATAILHLVTPNGIAVDLSVNAATPAQELAELMKAASMAAEIATRAGWTAASTTTPEAANPSAHELAQGPTFAGYPCSPTVDTAGLPTWIIANGRQCVRRERQGDVWWSAKIGEDQYEQVLKIPKGERAPLVVWPAGQQPPK